MKIALWVSGEQTRQVEPRSLQRGAHTCEQFKGANDHRWADCALVVLLASSALLPLPRGSLLSLWPQTASANPTR